jgi:L-threonylcarbamoyladenylate synthase
MSPDELEKAVDILRRGGVVVFPTDTVYGLGCDFSVHRSIERIYKIKGRSRDKALPVLIGSIDQVFELADYVPPVALSLAENFWPGALTLVLPPSSKVPNILSQNGGVALRWPDHPVPVALVNGLGRPIIGTSANLSGMPSALSADEAARQLGGKVDLILSMGPPPKGIESTVVDVRGEIPHVKREGAISRVELERIIGFPV